MLEKKTVIDQIEVLENGCIQIRQATKILDDGVEIGKTYQRWVLLPGDSLDGQGERVKKIAKAVWDKSVIEAYKASIKGELNG